jgi:hypothetical protein
VRHRSRGSLVDSGGFSMKFTFMRVLGAGMFVMFVLTLMAMTCVPYEIGSKIVPWTYGILCLLGAVGGTYVIFGGIDTPNGQ